MIVTKSPEELIIMREAARLVSKTLGMVASEIKPGIELRRLDELAEQFIRDHNGIPGFKGLYDCPSTLLISPNEEVVHGIPTDREVQEGDILSVDCGAIVDGFYGDHAYTFAVGEIDPEVEKLLQITKESLYIGIAEFKLGNRVGDVGHAIQDYCEKHGYGVVRELVGHGIGKVMHEDPQMPNYGRRGRGKKFKEGMTVAIEPMINLGTRRVESIGKWTIKTQDRKASAHFEHDVAIVNGEPRLLSTFDYIHEVLGISSNEEDPFRWTE
jgi:methionyl aminopeptidase